MFNRMQQLYYGMVSLRSVCRFVLFLSLLQISQARAASVQELYFAHTGGPGSLYEACINEFTERVNAQLPKNFRVVVVGQSLLGDDIQVLEKLKKGEVTLSLPSSVMSGISDTFGIFEMPFLIQDRAQIRNVRDILLGRYLQPEARKHGYRILAIWENGFRHITNNVRPIRRPEDLHGLKVRVPKGLWREKIFRALGAEPAPMAIHETYAALKSGTMDAQENPLQQIKGAKFHEVQRYLTFSGHVYTPAYVLVGAEAFDKLPPAVQEVLVASAETMQDWTYKAAIRMDSEFVDELAETMETNQLDTKAFRAATRPLYGEFVRSVDNGAKILDLLMGIAEVHQVR
jgi:tripartite ATP-independent transporter DctP family solute receptor